MLTILNSFFIRIQGYFKISDINFAILEVGGDISVLPKSSARPATTKDLNLNPPEERLAFSVIVEGKINKKNVRQAKVSEPWLIDQLQQLYKANPEEVFYAEVDSSQQLFVDIYDKLPRK
jgi:uncharacterized membrane protein YcaP (DUF421 family)